MYVVSLFLKLKRLLTCLVFQSYILLFELFAISLLGWYSYRRLDDDCELSTNKAPELTFSNVSWSHRWVKIVKLRFAVQQVFTLIHFCNFFFEILKHLDGKSVFKHDFLPLGPLPWF